MNHADVEGRALERRHRRGRARKQAAVLLCIEEDQQVGDDELTPGMWARSCRNLLATVCN